MAIVRGRLANIQTIPNTAGSIYTNPASTITFVSGFTIYNTSSTSRVVKLYNVPDSTGSLGTAGLTNQFLEVSIAGYETFIFEAPSDGIVLADTNDSLQAVTSTSNDVTIMIHGTKDI